jgi:Flp pilus assembly secretin CpaC
VSLLKGRWDREQEPDGPDAVSTPGEELPMIMSVLRIAAVALAASYGYASAGGDPFFADVDSVHAGTSGTVRVTIDFARLLTLDRAATTVVIGNPGLAVAQLSDDRTIILTGKTAGATNLIALDAEGREVTNVVLE